MPMSLAPVIPKSAWRRLADAVDRAAEHRDLDRVVVGLEAPLDLGDHGVHVELEAPAGRAGDQHRAALAELQRLEDLPGDLDLLLGVEGRERDPDRVADPVGQQRAEPDRRLQRPRPLRPGLGDAEVQRIRESARDSRRLEAIVLGTLVDFIETLKFVKSSRSISSTNSTAAVTSASTGFSNSSSRRCSGSEPELTPIRSGVPSSLARCGRPARPCRGRRCCRGSAARSGRRRRAPSAPACS